MPTLTIDGKPVTVSEGASVLGACSEQGIEIPAMCFLKGFPHFTSCMVCVVKDVRTDRLIPACSAPAQEGMVIETGGEEVRDARRVALELLLSDHLGDCEAPCRRACPASMNIPLMIRQIESGDLAAAIRTVKRNIALPAVLGRICPAPCEKVCRRGQHDEPVGICLLKRYVADADLGLLDNAAPNPALSCSGRRESSERAERECIAEEDAEVLNVEESGKRVAIVGSGPVGLAAAYHLRQFGHACTVLDERAEPGGELRTALKAAGFDCAALEAEIDVIHRLGVEFSMSYALGRDVSLVELRETHDAVVLAVGFVERSFLESLGLELATRGIHVAGGTYETSVHGVFAGGGAAGRGKMMAVRALGDGKEIAHSVNQYLRGEEVRGELRRFNCAMPRLDPEELEKLVPLVSDPARGNAATGTAGFTPEQAVAESGRCLHCDCRRPDSCLLRQYADEYGAKQHRYRGEGRRSLVIVTQHADVIYEPGKCIKCGRCVRITEREAEHLGLTFIGRGFDVQVGVPFHESLAEGLRKTAAACVEACPTGALAWR